MKFAGLFLISLALVLSGCWNHRAPSARLVNVAASLPAGLPYDPLKWRVIAATIDNRDSIMATLFGNDPALDHARTGSPSPYPPGSILVLVTWRQQDDQQWFGANIPGRVKSIEFVNVDSTPNQPPSHLYEIFTGNPLRKSATRPPESSEKRVDQILNLRASVMP